jgi:Biotin carboxylase, N-terminal domain
MHVRLADEAYCVGGAASRDSYLKMEKIIEVALACGAQVGRMFYSLIDLLVYLFIYLLVLFDLFNCLFLRAFLQFFDDGIL